MSLELFILASAGSLLYSATSGGGSGEAANPLGTLIGTALGGVVGNQADDLARLLATRMADGGLPVNHHVQKAGQEALAATLGVLAEAVAAEMAEAGRRPPLFEAVRRRLENGDLFAQPLFNVRDFPEPLWLEALLRLTRDQGAPGRCRRGAPADRPLQPAGQCPIIRSRVQRDSHRGRGPDRQPIRRRIDDAPAPVPGAPTAGGRPRQPRPEPTQP